MYLLQTRNVSVCPHVSDTKMDHDCPICVDVDEHGHAKLLVGQPGSYSSLLKGNGLQRRKLHHGWFSARMPRTWISVRQLRSQLVRNLRNRTLHTARCILPRTGSREAFFSVVTGWHPRGNVGIRSPRRLLRVSAPRSRGPLPCLVPLS